MMVKRLSSKYEAFSYLYEAMNYDIPYSLWIDIIEPFNKNTSILDVGCGTGEILKQLTASKKIGIDNSETMIEIATRNDDSSQYFVNDMKNFKLNESFDLVIATVDVLNYVEDLDSFKRVLLNVYEHLNDDGVFIFDIHSESKVNAMIEGEMFTDESDDFVYIWNTVKDDDLSLHHELTFFIKNEDDLYERYFESHYQRTFTHDTVLNVLQALNFKLVKAFSDFDSDGTIRDYSERTFYIVKK